MNISPFISFLIFPFFYVKLHQPLHDTIVYHFHMYKHVCERERDRVSWWQNVRWQENITLNISSLNGGCGAKTRRASVKHTATNNLTSLSLWWSKLFFTREWFKGLITFCSDEDWPNSDKAVSACCYQCIKEVVSFKQ